MQLADFLSTVITAKEGYFCLALGANGGWVEEWYRWPKDIDKIVARAQKTFSEYNVYFSSYLFAAPQSTKDNVLPTRTIQADLDHADVLHLPKPPTVLVETSPGRHQAYWVLKEALDPEAHEVLSRKITYAIPDCDRSGWPLGRKVRLPSTLNYKYLDGPKEIKIVASSMKSYPVADFELLPDVPHAVAEKYDDGFLDGPTPIDIHPLELLEGIKDRIPSKVYIQYNTPAKDRSAALWALLCAGFRAGLNRDQVFWLAKGSTNNKFADLRHHGDRELSKDVLRAEAVVHSAGTDERAIVLEARRMNVPVIEKRQHIQDLIIQFMKQNGDFIHTTADTAWYVRRDVGRPIHISPRSEYLDTLLDLQFGLNLTETDQAYVVAGLCSYSKTIPVNGVQAALSYFDTDSHTLLLHTGRKDVIRITQDAIERVTDGSYGVIFPWQNAIEAFSPSYAPLPNGEDWGEVLFGQSVNSIIGMERHHALAILKVWLMFLLFRNASISRPILATFGQPGAGKSTLFRKTYAFLYGRQKSLGSVTTPDDFDHSVASDPLVVLDNVDTWERWLPDRLALSASTSDIVKRKLYTDADTVVLKRQALVGITAHNPRFGREDVADRLLLLTLKRLSHFVPEGVIMADIARHRNALWGAIIRDAQRVLQTPMPADHPQFRVEDFARLGAWIATALGIYDDFAGALEKIRFGQKSFTLEEESILVNAIRTMLAREKEGVQPRTAGQLWTALEAASGDALAFSKAYRNSVYLGKKLWSLQDALKQIFEIEATYDYGRAARVWTIRERPQS